MEFFQIGANWLKLTRSEVSTTGGILPKLTLHEVMRKVQFGTFGPVTLELRNDRI